MAKSILLVVIIALSFTCCKKEEHNPKEEDRSPLEISLGKDTTIAYGETLVLDPGPGFASYRWNDGISEEQVFEVTEAGFYWVEVSDVKGRIGVDTIKVNICQPKEECVDEKEVQFFQRYSIIVPCAYNIKMGTGDDSESFQVRSDDEEIVLTV